MRLADGALVFVGWYKAGVACSSCSAPEGSVSMWWGAAVTEGVGKLDIPRIRRNFVFRVVEVEIDLMVHSGQEKVILLTEYLVAWAGVRFTQQLCHHWLHFEH